MKTKSALVWLTVVAAALFLLSSCDTTALGGFPDTESGQFGALALDGVVVFDGDHGTVALYSGRKGSRVGSVEASLSGKNLALTYRLDAPWSLQEVHVWVGEYMADMPQTRSGNPKVGRFPFKDDTIADVAEYTVLVPLDTLAPPNANPEEYLEDLSVYVAAHAQIRAGRSRASAWAGEYSIVKRGNWARYFALTFEAATEEMCETAYARAGESDPFLDGAGFLVELNPEGRQAFTREDVPLVVDRMGEEFEVGTVSFEFSTNTNELFYSFTLNEAGKVIGEITLFFVTGLDDPSLGDFTLILISPAEEPAVKATGFTNPLVYEEQPVYVIASVDVCHAD